MYAVVAQNHQRPVFKRTQQAPGNVDVFLYFWDERDGESFSGWWFGPKVGGDQVWVYNPEKAMVPPTAGWHVPYGGPQDPTLIVRAAAAPIQKVPDHQQMQHMLLLQKQEQARHLLELRKREAQLRQQEDEERRKRNREELLQKAREASLGRKAEEELMRKQQQALVATRAAVQKIRLATPATFDKLKQEVEELLKLELPKCGPEAANLLFSEANKHIEFARQRVEGLKEQQRKVEERKREAERIRKEMTDDGTGHVAPPKVDVPAAGLGILLGRGGMTLKRLRAATACAIEVPQRWPGNDGLIAVRLTGAAKQRRLAAEAIHLVLDGGDIEDVAAIAKGALVVPHSLGHAGRQEWLTWRLKPVEHGKGLRAEITRTSVRMWPTTDGHLVSGSPEWDAAKAAVDVAVEEAQALVELFVDAKPAHEPTDERIAAALAPLTDRYYVLAKALQPEDEITPILVLGPPDAARDAAALLWAQFVQGRQVAAVLQAPGRVQAMADLMAKDFDKDLRALEDECEVEVNQAESMVWISGSCPEAVAGAQQTVCEMLQFYLPGEFRLVEGLSPAVVEQLKQDAELRSLVLTSGCAVRLDGAAGTAWLCGPARAEVQQRIEALARGVAKVAAG